MLKKIAQTISLFVLICWPLLTWAYPQGFIANKGQWHADVLYKCHLPSGAVFVTAQGFYFSFIETSPLHSSHSPKQHIGHTHSSFSLKTDALKGHAYRWFFNQATIKTIVPTDTLPGRFNFFLGRHNHATGLNAYQQLTIKNLYPNIDMELRYNNGLIKYTFVVGPGANAKQIEFGYEGLDTTLLNHGALTLKHSLGQITDAPPVAYWQSKPNQPLRCQLVQNQTTYGYQVFTNPNKAQNQTLIIDPELVFSSYSGSTADNWGNSACFDNQGHLYAVGTVFSGGFPTTMGAFDVYFNGFGNPSNSLLLYMDVGIMKYQPNGHDIIYGTYLGGFNADVPISSVVDSSGNLAILGITSSRNLPTTPNAFQPTLRGGNPAEALSTFLFNNGTDYFVSKLSPDGSTLLASTYIGGSGNDGLDDVSGTAQPINRLVWSYGDEFRAQLETDSAGNITVAGRTQSADFPIRKGFQTSLQDAQDGVVFQLNANLSDLNWSTYLGGSNVDVAYGLTSDNNTGYYVVGGTRSFDFPVNRNALQPGSAGGGDGFVAHIDGGQLLASTYVGTGSHNVALLADVDPQGNVTVIGQTQGSYPVTTRVYSNTGGNVFLHCLNPTLNTTVYSTVIGSGGPSPDFSPTAFMVDVCGRIYMAGWGGATNRDFTTGLTNQLRTTPDAYQTRTDGSDFYLAVLEPNAQGLYYATFFGGYSPSGLSQEHVDGGTSRFDPQGVVYQAVCAGCGGYNSYPTTSGAHSNINRSSNCNNAAFKFDMKYTNLGYTIENDSGCTPLTVVITPNNIPEGNVSISFGDGNTLVPQNNDSIITYTYTKPGNYNLEIFNGLQQCANSRNINKTITAQGLPDLPILSFDFCEGNPVNVDLPHFDSITYRADQNLSQILGQTYTDSVFTFYPTQTATYQITLTDTTKNLCANKVQTIKVEEKQVNADFLVNYIYTDCQGLPIVEVKNTGQNGQEYQWDFGDGTKATGTLLQHQYHTEGNYNISLKAINNNCIDKAEQVVAAYKLKLPNVVTENGDGLNDVFLDKKLFGQNYGLKVYNRWGKTMHTTDNYTGNWPTPTVLNGVYYYLLETPDRKTQCYGWVDVLR